MILLSFDIEEFDMPLEYGGEIPFEEQIGISRQGLVKILDLLRKHDAKATFFSTVVFAENNPDLIRQLLQEGHELASHTWYHSRFEMADLKKSKDRLSELFGTEISGLRTPRMMKVPAAEVAAAGYRYNSSLNPTWIPGRYNDLKVSRTRFEEEGLLQIPASVSPWRIPLFWLSFHHFPLRLYRHLAGRTLKKDGYLLLYFHPWEFMDIRKDKYRLPGFTTRHTGEIMVRRLDDFLEWLADQGETFDTMARFVDE